MTKLLTLLLVLIPSVISANSLLKHQGVESEYVLYLPDLSKKFENIISSKERCTLDSYRKMEQIIQEVYVWVRFQRSVDSLDMLNTLTEKLGTVGEQERPIYNAADVLNTALPDTDDITQDVVLAQLNQWRIRECTISGKGIHLNEAILK